jgi:hypothetical protein
MKTDVDLKDDVYMVLSGSDLMTECSGVLSKTKRPKDSVLEDVVISVLANNIGQSQEAYINVNIYVPQVIRDNQWEDDTIRLRVLLNLSKEMLESIHKDGFWLSLREQRTYEVEATHETLINNKMLYKIINE